MSLNKILSPVLFFFSLTIQHCKAPQKNVFWNNGKEVFSVQQIYSNERLPNVVCAKDGTIIAVWGFTNVRVRRSEDGGNTWGPEIPISSGMNGGGAIVDEVTGDILIFTEEKHPPAPLHVFRSRDHGKTWKEDQVTIKPDINGNMPSMSMNERGTTLMLGKYAGRLIRPTRFYAGNNTREYWHLHYTNAIYSDDRGKTWKTSAPFPAMGTGEATLEELSDGTIYYNSRRHMSTDGLSPRWRHIAWSRDGGETWKDLSVSNVLPDGPQHSDYGLMGGLVRLPVEGHDILLFSNIDMPDSTNGEGLPFEQRYTRRFRGTIWASFDGGKTWPVKKLVDEGSFAYSSLVTGRKGTPGEGLIYLFYESNGGAKIARFNLDWVTSGRDWKSFLNK